jgi:hypothetical protein
MHKRHGSGWRPLCLIFVALLATAAGCAIPTESEPRELGAEELPDGLVPTSAPPTTEPVGSDSVGVWYQTQSAGLRRVERAVDEASELSAIEALFEPIPEGSPDRLTNQWNDPDIELIGLERDGPNRLTINLSAIPPAAEGALAAPTFAQLVWTVTQVPFEIKTVRLQVEGEPIRMVAGKNGAGFIARSDFPNQPQGVPVTTTTAARPPRTSRQPTTQLPPADAAGSESIGGPSSGTNPSG